MWINDRIDTYGKSASEMLDQPAFLSDEQLIGVVLSDVKSCPAKTTCEAIRDSLYGTEYIPKGMTKPQEKRYKAMMELIKRFGVKKGPVLRTPQSVYEYTKHFAYEEQEHMVVITLNGSGELVSCNPVTKGLADQVMVHAREVFRDCIRQSGVAVVLVHNHPSGNVNPSELDFDVTKRLIEAGSLLGIRVLDHLVITTKGYYSMKENNDI